MHCEHVKLPDGTAAIVCTSHRPRYRRCRVCGTIAKLQCDWKTGGGKTCDRDLCAEHAKEVGPDKHLCPEHQVEYQFWIFRRVLEGPRARGGA